MQTKLNPLCLQCGQYLTDEALIRLLEQQGIRAILEMANPPPPAHDHPLISQKAAREALGLSRGELSGIFCPDCGAELVAGMGCLTCYSCGYERCG